MTKTLWVLLALTLTIGVHAQKATISGYVRDAKSLETLVGATLQNVGTSTGTTTNSYGYYALKTELGRLHLRINYVGYAVKDTVVNIQGDTPLDIYLSEARNELSEVTIIGKRESEIGGINTGKLIIYGEELKRTPALFGEADIIKYAQLLPGVARGQEGFSGLIVRGGGQDENLYLIDGNPMYNVNHLFGLFSTFNPDAIKTANLYKGSFPARFGGRLSSVLDVTTKDGDKERFGGTFSIGLISSRINLEGPIIKGRTSYSFSLRRTYLDLIARPILAMTNKRESDNSNTEYDKTDPAYYFYDANLKVNHKVNNRNHLFLSLYMGDDVLDFSNSMYLDKGQGKNDPLLNRLAAKSRWGNRMASLGWTHLFSPELFANTTVYYGQYASGIHLQSVEKSYSSQIDKDNNLRFGEEKSSHQYDYSITSSIRDLGVRTNFDWIPNNNHYVRLGASAIKHWFNPNLESRKITETYADEQNNLKREQVLVNPYQQKISAADFSAYIEDDIRFTNKLSANIGFHGALLNVQGKSYLNLQPRLSARYQLPYDFSVKASYAEMNQHVHLLQTSVVSLPTDMWVPVTAKLRPMHSRQVALGTYWENGDYEVMLEGYYKWLNNLIDYKDGASIYVSTEGWEERVAVGNGRSYGLELLARKNKGRLTGWLAYTLAWADRIYPNGEVNNGMRFRDKYDNRHKLNIVAMYKLTPRLDISATWCYSSGNRMTLPLEQYLTPKGELEDFVSERNNYEISAYQRLDLGLNWYRPKKNGRMGIWNFSLYNAYLHHNPFIVMMATGNTAKDAPEHPDKSYRLLRSISPFPCIPSISYTYKF